MDFDEKEVQNFNVYLDHIINGLLREQLIDSYFQYGNVEHMKKHFGSANEPGIILQPNRLGFELFYWAYGMGHKSTNSFLKEDTVFEIDEKIIMDNGFKRITGANNV